MIIFSGETHLLDHDYCESEPQAKRSKVSENEDETQPHDGSGDIVPKANDFVVCYGDAAPETDHVVRQINTDSTRTSEILQKEQWRKIEELEQKNAFLMLKVEELQAQVSNNSNSLKSENDLLNELMRLTKTKLDNSNSKGTYSATIQKFSLTMSTYSPKAYRYCRTPNFC